MDIDEMKKLKAKVNVCNDYITKQQTKYELLKDQQKALKEELKELGFENIEQAEKYMQEAVVLAEEFVDKIQKLESEIIEKMEQLEDE